MYSLIRKVLFNIDPEKAHHLVMDGLKKYHKSLFFQWFFKPKFYTSSTSLAQTFWGLNFKNPVGLAAGFDKDAKYIDALSELGFGFIEIGTLTPIGQSGNDKPRLFRLPEDKALINRMGFNNEGVDAAIERLKTRKSNIIVGGNIGKNKVTPNEDALSDYEYCFKALFKYVDYFTVNVSSPNTPNLRDLQDKEPLEKLLKRLQEINHTYEKPKPILLKIAPDLTNTQLDDIIAIVENTKIQGVVATNTTIDRSNLKTDSNTVEAIGMGGLSGLPVKKRSTEVIDYLYKKSNQKLFIMAAGGIFTAADAQEKLNAGAKLVQVYTGFIYEGHTIVKNICSSITLPKPQTE
jgi:dihydroorotate dehydrogenase